MSDGFQLRTEAFDAALQRRLATSSREHMLVLAEQARGLLRTVVEITPPGHAGVKAGTRAAQAHGESRVASDIYKVYGTPGGAYELIKEKDASRADVFWKMVQDGNAATAGLVFRTATGKSFAAFDGGTVHKRIKNRRGTVGRRKDPVFYVSDVKSLEDYVKDVQSRVHYLADGWEAAANKLGFTLPNIIARHDAPGTVLFEIGDSRLRIVATNSVKYASNTDIERRIQHALDVQTGKLQRQWDAYNDSLNKKAGL